MKPSKSKEIQENVYQWALSKNFTAPYGVLIGEHVSAHGKKFKSITFGYARTLDATVSVYHEKFMTVRTSRHGTQTFKSAAEMQVFLDTL